MTMDALSVGLATTAVVAFSTVVAAAITTYGTIRTTRESNAKELLRDDVDRLRSELEKAQSAQAAMRMNLIYALRQVVAYHQLEDVYFDKIRGENSGLPNTEKAKYRREAQAICGHYPHLNRLKGQIWIDQLQSGQTPDMQPEKETQD